MMMDDTPEKNPPEGAPPEGTAPEGTAPEGTPNGDASKGDAPNGGDVAVDPEVVEGAETVGGPEAVGGPEGLGSESLGPEGLNLDDILDPLSHLQAECDALKEQMLRNAAEAENTRRRAERDVAQARKYGHTAFARDLLAVVDNISRAVESLPEQRDALDEAVKNLVVGVEMVSRELEAVLGRHGITRIMPLGAKFDPSQHQAMFEVPTDEAAAGQIVQVAQAGWMLHDRLLTPAMVGVAKPLNGENGEKGGENSA